MRKNFGAKPYLYPQPVMIIGTYDKNGNANAMNAAWGGIVGMDKIIIDLSSHKTTDNLMQRKAFTVSIADAEHMTECDYVGIVSAKTEKDKMKKANFTTTKSEFVDAPIKVVEDSLYLGKIVNVNADEKILGDDCEISLDKFRPITYDTVHHGYYELGKKIGNAFKDGEKLK